MHVENINPWQHDHRFDAGNSAAQRGTTLVAWITVVMMVVEIAVGLISNSMALLADGFHMSSHAVAIGLSAFAYAAARKHEHDRRFAFGTWKMEVLGGFASAVFLLGVVGLMVYSAVERLMTPAPIHYREAIIIGGVGLVVNIVCALILGNAHHHGHGHDHEHGHGHDASHGAHEHDDLNLKSAYVHVLADAGTSVLAILALAGGWMFGWAWLDPVVAIVGAVVVALWARRLLIDTSAVLLDREMDHPVVDEIREAIAIGGADGEAAVADLHVWRVGRASYSCAVTVVTHDMALSANTVRRWLSQHEEIVHSTIEVQRCPEH